MDQTTMKLYEIVCWSSDNVRTDLRLSAETDSHSANRETTHRFGTRKSIAMFAETI